MSVQVFFKKFIKIYRMILKRITIFLVTSIQYNAQLYTDSFFSNTSIAQNSKTLNIEQISKNRIKA